MGRWLAMLAAGTARVFVVRNLDPWYSAYNAQASQTLYLAPEQRVRMW